MNPVVDTSSFWSVKTALGAIGSFLVMVGAGIEPSVGVWIISISGALLTSSLGEDKTSRSIILHLLIGLGWGIFGSQVIHSEVPLINQQAAAFFSSMFGVETTWFFIRNLKEATFVELVNEIINTIIGKFAWFKKKD